jgi:pilus assembly protein Flp/PilA
LPESEVEPEGNTVSDWMLKLMVAVRRRSNDKGQTAVEYLGIIAVVVAIVLAITGTDIGQSIYNAIVSKITEVTGG